MKRVLQVLSASIVGIGMFAGVAAADSVTCSGNISNTGPGSTNTVSCVDENDTSVSCVNNIVVSNDNDQNANSGSAFTTGNTSGGNANSGDANNANSTVVKVGASCAPVATTTTETPATPAGGSGGQVQGAQVTVTPVGSVHAGAGAGTAKNVSLIAAGLVGSAGVVAAGTLLRKRALSL